MRPSPPRPPLPLRWEREGERGDDALTPPAPSPTAVGEGERGDDALTPPAPAPSAVGEGERDPKVLRRSSVF